MTCFKRWFLVLAASVPASGITAAPLASFPSAVEKATGRRVMQLSTAPGDNYALDSAASNFDGGKTLVYRNVRDNNEATATYWSVDLDTKKESPLTRPGLVAGATVNGQYLYGFDREAALGNYTAVSRYDLKTGARTQVCALSKGWNAYDNVAVNADGSWLIFVEAAKWGRFAYACNVGSGERVMLIHREVGGVRFNPKDRMQFAYIDEPANGLGHVGVGRLDKRQVGSLFPTDPFINSMTKFDDIVFSANGVLGILGRKPNPADPKNFFRVQLGCDAEHASHVCGHEHVGLEAALWQDNLVAGPREGWYVGDGSNGDAALGEPYIHAVQLDPQTAKAAQIRLADGVGTAPKTGANVHYLAARNLVVWSAARTLAGATPAPRNVFAVVYAVPAK